METGLYEIERHKWALSFTCPHCQKTTATPITVRTRRGQIKLYCDNCKGYMKNASNTEKRFM